jgi:hypothetical protein
MSRLVPTAFAACLFASVALAAQDPAPPGNLQNEDQIIAWAKAARLTDNTTNPQASWNMLGALDEGLLWGSTQGPDAQGVAKVGVRLERFRPAAGVRSEAEMFDLNCQTQQIRGTFNAAFAQHNFSGAKTDRAVNATWAPVASNEIVSAIKDDACKAPAGPVININDPAAVRGWINANSVRDRDVGPTAGQWSILGATNVGLVYSLLARREDRTRTAFMLVRTERFAAAPNAKIAASLSETEEFEISCQNSRIRSIGGMRYASHNLQGRSDGERKLSDWGPIAQHPVLAKSAADLCREFQVQREYQSVGSNSRSKSGD